MGFLHDLLLETRCEQFEKDLKEAYGMGFRDGRLCPEELRPCLADGKPATFHRWVEEDKALLKINAFMQLEEQLKCVHRFHEEGWLDNCCSTEKQRTCFALVEYADGSVGKVKPELIQFLDRKEGCG